MAIKETFTVAKSKGWNKAFYDLFYRGINKLTAYKSIQGMVVTMEDINHKLFNTNQAYECRLLNADEVSQYSDLELIQLNSHFLRQAKEKKDFCMAVVSGRQILSYGWYSQNPTKIDNDLELHFENTFMYAYKSFTHPVYRGKRMHAFVKAQALLEFTKLGYRGLISYVEKNNYDSLKSNQRMGCKSIGNLHILKLPKKYLFLREKSCHEYGFNVKETKA